MNGRLLLVNKPAKKPVKQVTDKIRRVFRDRGVNASVCRANGLESFASGLLLVCIGKGTRKKHKINNCKKEYIVDINLSAFSSTNDATGELIPVKLGNPPVYKHVENCVKRFVGVVNQDYNQPELGFQPFKIFSIDILDYQWPKLKLKVVCLKDEYLGLLAKDIGNCLSTGGYLTALECTAVGDYTLDQAINYKELDNISESDFRPIYVKDKEE